MLARNVRTETMRKLVNGMRGMMRRITSVLTVLVFAGWAGSASAVPS